jgi:PAS domain S-box-containing protein
MQFQYVPYVCPLIISASISLSLGIYALFRRRNAKGSISFILCMLVATIWCTANALEISASNLPTKLFWANMQYFAYCYSPVTLLVLCMQFTGYNEWVQNRKILWLTLLPTIILILVWTDGQHGWIRYDIHMNYGGLFPVIAKKYGPVFFIHAAYSYLLNVSAAALLIRGVFYNNTVYRRQVAALLAGLSLIVIPNLLYILGLGPVQRFDITPVFFGPAGLIIAWGIFRFKLFDLVPLARATVIELMDAGVMVLDLQNRVLDINPAFEKIIGLSTAGITSNRVEEACANIPGLAEACTDRNITQTEFSIDSGESLRVYELLLSPLVDSRGMLIGRLVISYEITKKKLAEQEYMKQQWKLAVIEERERMARDMHDNLGQVLGFINLQAQGIRQELANAGIGIASHKLDKLVNVTQSAHNEIRAYIRSSRSLSATENDLISDLIREILIFEEQAELKVKLDIPMGFTGEELEPNAKVNVLYIVKEALNNITKHAKALNVRISVAFEQEQLCAVIEDDGKGFNLIQYDKNTRNNFGLNIMRERAAAIGAQIDIESAVDQGSRIVLRVPFKKGAKNGDEINAGR